MKNLLLSAVLVTLPLLLGGCGGEKKESVVEIKPVEEVPLNPNLKYEIKDDEVTITGCDKKASGELTIPATIEGKPVTSIGKDAHILNLPLPADEADQFFSQHSIIYKPTHTKNRHPRGGVPQGLGVGIYFLKRGRAI